MRTTRAVAKKYDKKVFTRSNRIVYALNVGIRLFGCHSYYRTKSVNISDSGLLLSSEKKTGLRINSLVEITIAESADSPLIEQVLFVGRVSRKDENGQLGVEILRCEHTKDRHRWKTLVESIACEMSV